MQCIICDMYHGRINYIFLSKSLDFVHKGGGGVLGLFMTLENLTTLNTEQLTGLI